MIMLKDSSFDFEKFRKDFTENYSHEVNWPEDADTTVAFEIDGELTAIGIMEIPIPSDDIESTAEYSYNWMTVLEDTRDHQAHLIVTMIHGTADMVKRYKIFTEVIVSLLRTTEAIGVYKGNQSLLIPKDYYIEEASLMDEEFLPLNLWIYFGLRSENDNGGGYTYGLAQFNKTEMEIVDSGHSLEEIREFLFNMAHYVLEFNVTFRDGETCGTSEEEKIKISYSNGKYIDGKSFKLAF
jgi:hypothetical protein